MQKNIYEVITMSDTDLVDLSYRLAGDKPANQIYQYLVKLKGFPMQYLCIDDHLFKFFLVFLRDYIVDYDVEGSLQELNLSTLDLKGIYRQECPTDRPVLLKIVTFNYESISNFFLINETQFNILNEFITKLSKHESVVPLLESLPNQEYTKAEKDFIYKYMFGGCIDSKIPENSETIGITSNTSRFSGAMWYEAIQQKTIVLAGVGGIGSYVGFLLSRMNPKALFIYDNDIVEEANMSGQLYSINDVKKYKVDCLANMIKSYSRYHDIFSIPNRFTQDCEGSDIMICGFDNMEARKVFFDKWCEHVKALDDEGKKHCLFIDGRLAAEELQVYCVTGDNEWKILEYKKSLFSDSEAEETICSYKQTSYMANMIGSIIVNLFVNFVANEMLEFEGRELPLFTSYNGISMQLKLE